MQNIIEKIQSGELSQKQLIAELVAYENNTVDEYNAVVDIAEQHQAQITALEKAAAAREEDIKVIANEGLKAVSYSKTLESENLRLKADNKDIKLLRNENKALKKLKAKHIETAKKQQVRIDSLLKDCRDYRNEIKHNRSDIARLRLTGWKSMGKYAFTIFPSRTNVEDAGSTEKQVNLVIMDKIGNMKILGVNKDGIVTQPRSHNFKLEDEHIDFVTGFDRIAREDGYTFSDRVLQLVN